MIAFLPLSFTAIENAHREELLPRLLTASALEVKEPDVFPLVMILPPTRSSVVTLPRFHSLSPAAIPASSLLRFW